jgi:hypothetical protein
MIPIFETWHGTCRECNNHTKTMGIQVFENDSHNQNQKDSAVKILDKLHVNEIPSWAKS